MASTTLGGVRGGGGGGGGRHSGTLLGSFLYKGILFWESKSGTLLGSFIMRSIRGPLCA